MLETDDTDTVIDPTFYGNMERILNHTCAPSAKFQKLKLASSSFVVVSIFAQKNIEVGEEDKVDYLWRQYNRYPVVICKCGATWFRHYI